MVVPAADWTAASGSDKGAGGGAIAAGVSDGGLHRAWVADAGRKKPVLSLVDAKGFPGYDEQYGKPLRLLMGMVGLVLLIALTNVVMLLMARNATRQREFSMKLALGAGRGDLLRQLLTESLLLVTAGGLAGVVLCGVSPRGRWEPGRRSNRAWRRTARCCGSPWACWWLLSFCSELAPLRIALAAGPSLALKTSAAASSSDTGKIAHGQNHRRVLQMTVCVVLLVAAGLLIRTLRNLENTPLGFDRSTGWSVFGVKPEIHVTRPGQSVLSRSDPQIARASRRGVSNRDGGAPRVLVVR